MSLREKYGTFRVKEMLFYDEQERDYFLENFTSTYKNFISKINGKRVIGHGKLKRKTEEEKDALKVLDMQMRTDDEHNIVEIAGYGHRRLIFPLELWLRKLFDEGRIVTYEAEDSLIRSVDFSEEEINEDLKDFYNERKRRIEAYKKGELEPPTYRSQNIRASK